LLSNSDGLLSWLGDNSLGGSSGGSSLGGGILGGLSSNRGVSSSLGGGSVGSSSDSFVGRLDLKLLALDAESLADGISDGGHIIVVFNQLSLSFSSVNSSQLSNLVISNMGIHHSSNQVLGGTVMGTIELR
jgi:hypothetical protein